jgi:hypothetical protein
VGCLRRRAQREREAALGCVGPGALHRQASQLLLEHSGRRVPLPVHELARGQAGEQQSTARAWRARGRAHRGDSLRRPGAGGRSSGTTMGGVARAHRGWIWERCKRLGRGLSAAMRRRHQHKPWTAVASARAAPNQRRRQRRRCMGAPKAASAVSAFQEQPITFAAAQRRRRRRNQTRRGCVCACCAAAAAAAASFPRSSAVSLRVQTTRNARASVCLPSGARCCCLACMHQPPRPRLP